MNDDVSLERLVSDALSPATELDGPTLTRIRLHDAMKSRVVIKHLKVVDYIKSTHDTLIIATQVGPKEAQFSLGLELKRMSSDTDTGCNDLSRRSSTSSYLTPKIFARASARAQPGSMIERAAGILRSTNYRDANDSPLLVMCCDSLIWASSEPVNVSPAPAPGAAPGTATDAASPPPCWPETVRAGAAVATVADQQTLAATMSSIQVGEASDGTLGDSKAAKKGGEHGNDEMRSHGTEKESDLEGGEENDDDAAVAQEDDEDQVSSIVELQAMTVLWFLACCAPSLLLLDSTIDSRHHYPETERQSIIVASSGARQREKRRWLLFELMRTPLATILARPENRAWRRFYLATLRQEGDLREKVTDETDVVVAAAGGCEEVTQFTFWRGRAVLEMQAFVAEKNCLRLRDLYDDWLTEPSLQDKSCSSRAFRLARNPMRAVQAIHKYFGTVWSMPALSRKYVRRKRREMEGHKQAGALPETASQNGENMGKDEESSSTKGSSSSLSLTLEQVWDLALKGLSKNGEKEKTDHGDYLTKASSFQNEFGLQNKSDDSALDVSIDIGKAGAAKDAPQHKSHSEDEPYSLEERKSDKANDEDEDEEDSGALGTEKEDSDSNSYSSYSSDSDESGEWHEEQKLYAGRTKKWWFKAGAGVTALALLGPVGLVVGVAGVAAVQKGENHITRLFTDVEEEDFLEQLLESEESVAESALPGQNDEEIGANEDNDEGHKGGENEGDDERNENGNDDWNSSLNFSSPLLSMLPFSAAARTRKGEKNSPLTGQGKKQKPKSRRQRRKDLVIREMATFMRTSLGREKLQGDPLVTLRLLSLAHEDLTAMPRPMRQFLTPPLPRRSPPPPPEVAVASNSTPPKTTTVRAEQTEVKARGVSDEEESAIPFTDLLNSWHLPLSASTATNPTRTTTIENSSVAAPLSSLPRRNWSPRDPAEVSDDLLQAAETYMLFSFAVYGGKLLEEEGLLGPSTGFRQSLRSNIAKDKSKQKSREFLVAERAAIAFHAGVRSMDVIALSPPTALGGDAGTHEQEQEGRKGESEEGHDEAYPRLFVAKRRVPKRNISGAADGTSSAARLYGSGDTGDRRSGEKETAIETEIVVAIRGTLTTADILSDLQCRPVPFLGGTAHGGAVAATLALMEALEPTLKYVRVRYPGCRIVITGHSLGAACACLLTMLLKQRQHDEEIALAADAGGREETDQSSGASDEIRPGSVVGAGGAATNTGRTAGTTTASHANTSPEPGALRNHEIACFAFAPPPVFAFRAEVGACFGGGGGGGGGGTSAPHTPPPQRRWRGAPLAAAEVTTCFVHGDDLVSRWSYRTAWLLGRQVRCVDRLCCWSSLERGARAFGAKKENTAEVIHGATADFVEWRRRRRDDGEDQFRSTPRAIEVTQEVAEDEPSDCRIGNFDGADRPSRKGEVGAAEEQLGTRTMQASEKGGTSGTTSRNKSMRGKAPSSTRPELPAMIIPGAVYHLFRPPMTYKSWATLATGDEKTGNYDTKLCKKNQGQLPHCIRRVDDQSIFQGMICLDINRSPLSDHSMNSYATAIRSVKRQTAELKLYDSSFV